MKSFSISAKKYIKAGAGPDFLSAAASPLKKQNAGILHRDSRNRRIKFFHLQILLPETDSTVNGGLLR